MRPRPSVPGLLGLLGLLVLLSVLPIAGAGADPQPAQPASAAQAVTPPEPRDARGWRSRPAPPDPAPLLTRAEPQAVVLPAPIAERLHRSTLLLYLSPGCPHCIQALPEIVLLSSRITDVADLLCVVSGSAGAGEVARFQAEWNLPFPVIHDLDHAFALATGLDSTPSLLVVEPTGAGTEVRVTEAWLPYVRGAAPVLEMRLRGGPEVVMARGEPVGVLACSACHGVETRSWSSSRHAVAYYDVVRKGFGDDLPCLGCHATALDPASGTRGFRPGDHRSPFADVGCEACHTPAGPHDADGGAPGDSCVRCHDADHGRFVPRAGLAAIDHFRAAGLGDEALREARVALATGAVPRVFPALPSGPSVGAGACASCHKAETRAWRKTAHARAMDALTGPDRAEGACVSCHATPLGRVQDTPTPDAFRMDESVGCESCHGPSGPHAADPSVPSVSLDSRDPECGVERICTRCHTPERDPDWSLRQALLTGAH